MPGAERKLGGVLEGGEEVCVRRERPACGDRQPVRKSESLWADSRATSGLRHAGLSLAWPFRQELD
jgi:hypothetical protein